MDTSSNSESALGGSTASQPLSTLRRISLVALILLIGGGGALHFVIADFYAPLIPSWLGNRHAWVYGSGVAEMACGFLLAIPKTRRIGAWATIVVLILVFPGNIKMAFDSTMAEAQPPANSPIAAWIRLPFQALFIWWAYSFTRSTGAASVALRTEPDSP